MKASKLGKPLFKRTYGYGDGKKLVVQIWNPGRYGGLMMCWFRIKGMNRDAVHRAVGMDRLDALYHAMQTIGMLLDRFRESQPTLNWSDALYKSELGLPHPYKVPSDECSGEWTIQPPPRTSGEPPNEG